MTIIEIEEIKKFQQLGFGYKKIASLTGFNANSVKSYCRRHPIKIKSQPVTDAFCKGCGTPISRIEKKKPRQFCSDSCRMKWWNAYQYDNLILILQIRYFQRSGRHSGQRRRKRRNRRVILKCPEGVNPSGH